MLLRVLFSGDIKNAILALALMLPAVILCLSVHEMCHGLAAYALGDKTAENAGRLTLNPLAHIDPIGFLCLLFLGFGWARPVPVNMSNLKHRKRDMALVALAGPVSNFLTAMIFFAFYIALRMMNSPVVFIQVLIRFCSYVAQLSVGLGVFNLIPVPPLDGSHVLEAILPLKWTMKLQQYQSIVLLGLIALLYFGGLDQLIWTVSDGIFSLVQNIFLLFLR